ncbi:hypothetical protein [Klebsiella sp. K4-170]|uniref:hypothetical protein n=1 Tax=Klebsiella sp. K4-170 TaxID=2920184 RepID=UPI0024DE04BF|nr:hypothetical protein [Klebsiella sp. K4-170]MDK1905266.1 hypothetical protein [Klebsiella sp. K4-170]
MPTFTQTGTGKYDYWLLDGGKTFSTIPANTLPSIDADMPIRLQVGDGYFGSTHITARHGKWLERYQPDGCVATFVHKKLSTSGKILLLEEKNKIGLALTLNPNSALILRNIGDFFSITTLYYRKSGLEGDVIGRYTGYEWATSPYIERRR